MAAAARREARRKRILENSGERLQKIIDSQNSAPKIDAQCTNRPIMELQSNDFSENSEQISKKESSSTNQSEVEGHFSLPTARLDNETSHGNEEHINKSTRNGVSEVTEVKESVKGGWIRFCLNVLLGVFLVVVSEREVNGILQYFFGPWIALQICMFSIPLLRQGVTKMVLSWEYEGVWGDRQQSDG